MSLSSGVPTVPASVLSAPVNERWNSLWSLRAPRFELRRRIELSPSIVFGAIEAGIARDISVLEPGLCGAADRVEAEDRTVGHQRQPMHRRFRDEVQLTVSPNTSFTRTPS